MTRPRPLGDAMDAGVGADTAAVMLEHAREALVLLEASGEWLRIVYANQAFGELTPQRLRDLANVGLDDVLSSESDPEELIRLRCAVQKGATAHAVLVLADDNGSPRWVEADVAPLERGHGTVRAVATLREITEQIRRARLLQVGGSRAHELLAVADPDGRVARLEPPQRLVLGREPDEVIGRSIIELVHPEDAETVRAALAAPDGCEPLIVRLRHADGSWRWVELYVDDQHGDARIGGLVLAGRDVSGREHAHTELARTTTQLQMAVAAAELGCWQLDLADHTITIDAHAAAQFATDPDAPPMTLEEALGRVHPDDRQALRQAVDHAVNERGGFERTFRVIRAGERWRWLLARVHVVCAPDGTPTQLTGVTLDVTEQHATADRVTPTVETLTDAYFALDTHWRFVFLNTSAEELLGRSRAELIGRPVGEVLPASIATVSERGYQRAAATGEPVAFQAYAAPAGRWYEIRVFPGEHGLVVIHRDVTDQMRTEAEQQRLLSAERSARREAEGAQAELAHIIAHDELTGLANRVEAERRVRQQLIDSAMTVLLIDLDDFNRINNSLGHAVGDTVLSHVAERLAHRCRPSTLVARFGGDKFLVPLEEIDLHEALQVAERLREAISEPCEPVGTLSASVGLATAAPGERADVLIRNADTALAVAKQGRRGRVVVYDDSLHEEARERLETEKALRATRHGEQLTLHYQPIFELTEDRRVGAEALLRWDHPTRGLLSPGAFIELAETTGLIVPIGAWVIDAACRTIAAWRATAAFGTVWVNVAAPQLARADFVRTIVDAQQQHGIRAGELGIELTERALIANPEAAGAQLAELHRAGVRIAIDDFGTGYSSMSSLQQHPIDVLKIDKSFTARLHTDDGEAICRAIVELAHALGVTASAEGVEASHQLAALRHAGCDTAAGYLLADPEPADRSRERPRPAVM